LDLAVEDDEEDAGPSTGVSPMEDVRPASPEVPILPRKALPPTKPAIQYKEAFTKDQLKALGAAYVTLEAEKVMLISKIEREAEGEA
jgi:hypothetical protein